MNVPLWVAELAASFCRKAGDVEPFPRQLLKPIDDSVPLSVVSMRSPTVDSVRNWLHENGIGSTIATPNRRLRACLYAQFGNGFAFVDADDLENEQRFSLAHELAHFLRDYLQPRERAVNKLGPRALEVLDGLRPATPSERVDAYLSRTRIGYHVHFMDRDPDDGLPTKSTSIVEDDADRLAYELLAPAEVIAATLTHGLPSRRVVTELLIERFGFPRQAAERYANLLCPRVWPIDPLIRGLAEAM